MPIWKQKLLSRYQSAQGGAGGEDGSGGGGADDATAEAIRKAVEEQTAGLKAKNSELIGKLKERDDRIKEFDSKLKEFDGIDPNAVRNILKRFADDEEAKLIADGKIDDVLNKRTERMKADYDKKLSEALSKAEQAEKRAQAFQGRVLDDSIRAAAAKAGIHQHAIDDALLRARSIFALGEDGQAVQLGEDGRPVLGKDGKSPFTPLEWLEGMKEKAPHWFPASASGSGAGGGGGGGTQPSKGNFGGTKAERLAAIRALSPELNT